MSAREISTAETINGRDDAHETIDQPALHSNHFITAPRATERAQVVWVNVRRSVFGRQVDLRMGPHWHFLIPGTNSTANDHIRGDHYQVR